MSLCFRKPCAPDALVCCPVLLVYWRRALADCVRGSDPPIGIRVHREKVPTKQASTLVIIQSTCSGVSSACIEFALRRPSCLATRHTCHVSVACRIDASTIGAHLPVHARQTGCELRSGSLQLRLAQATDGPERHTDCAMQLSYALHPFPRTSPGALS